MTAGAQKIFHSDPRIGFLAQASALSQKRPALEQAITAAKASGSQAAIQAAEKELRENRLLHFNNVLDAVVTATFLALITAVALLSAREWILLLARRKLAVLRETEPVWLPDYALAESKALPVASLLALGVALAKELSGEAQIEREQVVAGTVCDHLQDHDCAGAASGAASPRASAYVAMTEQRFNGVRRCC